jgi:sulfhydrogenase subunit delta
MKLRIGIFDLTDCEGCQVELINLKEKLLDVARIFRITRWRLLMKGKGRRFDAVFIEGSPMTQGEISLVKNLRERSDLIIAFGNCACVGGLQAMLDEKERKRLLKIIYSPDYIARARVAKPLGSYTEVDFCLNGCPPDRAEIERMLASLAIGKILRRPSYPVCFECKSRESPCLLLDEKPCLGPITIGGCKAICPSNQFPCFGCSGAMKQANLEAIRSSLLEFISFDDLQKKIELFLKVGKDEKGGAD